MPRLRQPESVFHLQLEPLLSSLEGGRLKGIPGWRDPSGPGRVWAEGERGWVSRGPQFFSVRVDLLQHS